ncbi:MAG: hypothetical protein EBR09_17080 [Proteobacteria bacterium]|nr:hypothetical protein [Pseudomonadota bacterium]
MKIALIGAGAAGAACVSVLRNRRADFSIFEKSRGVGGRMTTRRVSDAEEFLYDHGCPFFEWPESVHGTLGTDVHPATVKSFGQDFVACPSMPQLVKDLFGSQKILTRTEILKIERTQDAWTLEAKTETSDGPATESYGPFDKIIFTAPAPQTAKMIGNNSCSWRGELDKIRYFPSWSLMFTVRSAEHSASPLTDGIFEKLIMQNAKPARKISSDFRSWVGQVSAGWSQENLERRPDEIISLLLPHALNLVRAASGDCVHSAAHRWRYSQISHPLGCEFLADDSEGLYFISDGCLGRGVAGALQSGIALGRHLGGA